MEAKLIKDHSDYHLVDDKQFIIGTTDKKMLSCTDKHKLSLKNCQAIERGYDLDELVEIEFPLLDESWCRTGAVHEENLQLLGHKHSYIKGFQKALELMGDKKFSEEDIKIAIRFGFDVGFCSNSDNKTRNTLPSEDSFIQSLQQTEWEVTFNPDEKDSEGCLVLKRL